MEELEKLNKKYEEIGDELIECENHGLRLIRLSNELFKEIEENKKLKNNLEIDRQRVSEKIMQFKNLK